MPHPLSIPEWELDQVRDDLHGFYDFHCRIERVTGTDDPYGGHTEARATIQDQIHCYVEGGVAHEQDRVVAEGLQREHELFTISMPAFTDVRVGDWVVVYAHHADVSEPGILEVRVSAVIGPESHEIERRVIGYRAA